MFDMGWNRSVAEQDMRRGRQHGYWPNWDEGAATDTPLIRGWFRLWLALNLRARPVCVRGGGATLCSLYCSWLSVFFTECVVLASGLCIAV